MDVFRTVIARDLTALRRTLSSSSSRETLNQVDGSGQSLLFLASRLNHLDQVKYLLQCGVDPELAEPHLGWTAIIAAASKNHTDIVKELLQHQVEENAQSTNGQSALWTAAYKGYSDLVQLLLDRGANPDLCNTNGGSPLFAATQQDHTSCVQILLKHGCNIDRCMQDGATALYMAAQKGNAKMVDILLEAGADPERRYKTGASALIVACGNGHVAVVKSLLGRGVARDTKKLDGSTALHRAVEVKNLELVKLLLSSGAGVLKNKNSQTALDIAKARGYTDIAEVIEAHTKVGKSGVSKFITGTSYIGVMQGQKFKRRSAVKRHSDHMKGNWGDQEPERQSSTETTDKTCDAKHNEDISPQQGTKGSSFVGKLESNVSSAEDKASEKRQKNMAVNLEEARRKLRLMKLSTSMEQDIHTAEDPLAALWDRINEAGLDNEKRSSTTDEVKDLTNKDLMQVAQKLGSKWKQLGAYLEMGFEEIEKFQKDNPEDMVYAAWAMLANWRDKDQVAVDEKRRLLKQACRDLGRADLMELL